MRNPREIAVSGGVIELSKESDMTIVAPDEAGYWLDEYDGPRFWAKVNLHGGTAHTSDPLATAKGECWQWTGSLAGGGYGKFDVYGKEPAAHRVAFIDCGGKVAKGQDLDHLCRNRGCVRPSHLQAVTRAENISRGLVALVNRGVCRNGHPVTEDNLATNHKGHAVCVTCRTARRARAYTPVKRKTSTPAA